MEDQPTQQQPLEVTDLPEDKPMRVPTWEQAERIGYVKAMWVTIKQVLLEPTSTFQKMSPTGFVMRAFVFALIIGTVSMIAYAAYGYLFERYFNDLRGGTKSIGILGWYLYLPIWAALIHFCLRLYKASTQPFVSTFRVVCYGMGSAAAILVVPIIGKSIFACWGLVVVIVGLKEQNKISLEKAILAAITPGVAFALLLVSYSVFMKFYKG